MIINKFYMLEKIEFFVKSVEMKLFVYSLNNRGTLYSFAGPPLCNTVIILRDPLPYPQLCNLCTTPSYQFGAILST